jgi:hypothetical protein
MHGAAINDTIASTHRKSEIMTASFPVYAVNSHAGGWVNPRGRTLEGTLDAGGGAVKGDFEK